MENKEFAGIEKTLEWFQRAVPNPTIENACVQMGCHVEEFAEMFEAVARGSLFAESANRKADGFKSKEPSFLKSMELVAESNGRREELFDAMIDQIVTAVGICHMLGFDVAAGLAEVNRSNFSKFENGQPVFDENGKIKKGKDYTPPELLAFSRKKDIE